MEQYSVTGMSCAACSARVEKAVSAVAGVDSCAVSLLTNSMGVEGTASPREIIKAVEEAGYGAALAGAGQGASERDHSIEEALVSDKGSRRIAYRLILSLCFLLPIMYLSMGHSMWNWPLPGAIASSPLVIGMTEMLLTICVMIINNAFFVNGFKSIARRAPNMDSLVALGASASFLYSLFVLFKMAAGAERAAAAHGMYFESAAMILTLITVGKLLESVSKGKTTSALKALIKMRPQTAVLRKDGGDIEVPADEVRPGDIFVIRPGDRFPADGTVIEGSSAVDESSLTGESVPVDKSAGSRVSAATINTSGFLLCKAERVGEDTAFSEIIRLVMEASATKAPVARMADKVAGIFVPAVIGVAAVTLLIWLFAGQTAGFAIARAVSVLVISCPCALGLATPVAIMAGSGIGAKRGILFKTAATLEETGKASIVIMDKTGTVTKGRPQVTDIFAADGDEEELILMAAALESKSEHPLAAAVTRYARERGLDKEEARDFRALPGSGAEGTLGGEKILGGSLAFISSRAAVAPELKQKADEMAEAGKTPLLFARGGKAIGIIATADTVKEDSAEAVKELKKMGLKVIILTGDNEKTARAVAAGIGADGTIAGVDPAGKAEAVKKLSAAGKVIMIGDGINDGPALSRADTGMAIGAGTDVAIDSADIVLADSTLKDAAAAIRLSRQTLRNVRQNLFWAFFYNIICIPLAAGAFYHLLGLTLNPMIAAAAMSLSSFCVVMNALRLNLFDIYDTKKDRPAKERADEAAIARVISEMSAKKAEDILNSEGEDKMKITMHVEGMMCPHCEARVKKALEGLDGVGAAEVSHEAGTAVISAAADIDDGTLKETVEKEGYGVTGIDR